MNPIGIIAVGVNRSPEPGAPIEFAKREAIRRPAPESKAGATTAAELMTTGVQTVTAATRVPAAARTMLGQHLSELDTRLDAQVAVRLIERVEGVVAVVDHLRFRTDERVADPNATPTY
jgi:CBS domain-containing protein